MGQELLNRGVIPHGTIWGATALLHKKYHKLLVKTHLDFINAGAEVIVTNSFGSRKRRLIDNNLEKYFKKLNTISGELAVKAVKKSKKKILIAGSLPPQNFTYFADLGNDLKFIKDSFFQQAKCLNPFVDFFYFDVLSSVREIQLAIEAIITFNKPYLIGAHISEGVKLPSGEKISDIIHKIKHKNLLGVMLSCVSPENYEQNLDELKNLGVPFGFKLNGFVTTKPKAGYTTTFNQSKTGNPNEFLGSRDDLTPEKMSEFVKTFKEAGATILGGCCETRPAHIMEMAKLK